LIERAHQGRDRAGVLRAAGCALELPLCDCAGRALLIEEREALDDRLLIVEMIEL